MWVATDQGEHWGEEAARADGLYALETEGVRRRTAKLFFCCPVGVEMCGPYFTPDQETLFLAVQHPGCDGTDKFKGFERASTFADPPRAGRTSIRTCRRAFSARHHQSGRRQDRLSAGPSLP
jgi:secreted PhoX family phosphatase